MIVNRAECLAPTKVDMLDREKETQRKRKENEREREREGQKGEGLVGHYIARKSGPPL